MILQQLSFSDINPEWLDLFSCLFSLKNTALPPKFTFMFRSPICWQDNEEKGVLLFFWQNHMIFVLKRNGPSLRTVAEPEQRSKEFNFTLKKKKKFYPNKSHFCRLFFFQYLDTNGRRVRVQLGCSTRRWNPRTQPQTWIVANWNSRPQQQHQLPAQGLEKQNPRLQQQHLQSRYLEKESQSPK